MIGRARIEVALVKGSVCIDLEGNAADLGEAAHSSRGREGRGFQGFQQFRAGDLDDAQGVSEGQNGVHVLLGDIALVDRRTDTAAVGDGRVYGFAVLFRAPDKSVSDQVAQVGFLGTVAGVLLAIEDGFSFCERRAVIVINLLLDFGGAFCDGAVFLKALGGDVLKGNLAVGSDGNHADVGQLGAGGGEAGLELQAVGSFLDLFQGRMGVTVDKHVNTLDFFQQVERTVALGLVVNSQMAQADDIIALLGFQGVDFLLSDVEHILTGGEGHALDLSGMGFGSGFGSGQAEDADFLSALGSQDGMGAFNLAIQHNVGGDDGKLGVFGNLLEVGVTVIELMIADGGCVVAGQVHQFHGGFALGDADGGIALNEVAGVQKQDLRARLLVSRLQSRSLGVSGNSAVYVVGVEDDDGAFSHVIQRAGRDGQREHHSQGQQQGQKFFPHACTSFVFTGGSGVFRPDCLIIPQALPVCVGPK